MQPPNSMGDVGLNGFGASAAETRPGDGKSAIGPGPSRTRIFQVHLPRSIGHRGKKKQPEAEHLLGLRVVDF